MSGYRASHVRSHLRDEQPNDFNSAEGSSVGETLEDRIDRVYEHMLDTSVPFR